MKITRLKDLREDKDMSQEDLAIILNCKQQTYSNYENGTRTLPYEMLIKLSKFYNVTTDYILGLTNKKNS